MMMVMKMSRLRELRKGRGYTQVKMQMMTGIDQSDYSKIESGKRFYTYEQLRRIVLALETSLDYLADLTDEKAPLSPCKAVKQSLPNIGRLFHILLKK